MRRCERSCQVAARKCAIKNVVVAVDAVVHAAVDVVAADVVVVDAAVDAVVVVA